MNILSTTNTPVCCLAKGQMVPKTAGNECLCGTGKVVSPAQRHMPVLAAWRKGMIIRKLRTISANVDRVRSYIVENAGHTTLSRAHGNGTPSAACTKANRAISSLPEISAAAYNCSQRSLLSIFIWFMTRYLSFHNVSNR